MGEPVVTALVNVWEIFGPTVVSGWIARCGMRKRDESRCTEETGKKLKIFFGEYDRPVAAPGKAVATESDPCVKRPAIRRC
jgi:hypothetical protein